MRKNIFAMMCILFALVIASCIPQMPPFGWIPDMGGSEPVTMTIKDEDDLKDFASRSGKVKGILDIDNLSPSSPIFPLMLLGDKELSGNLGVDDEILVAFANVPKAKASPEAKNLFVVADGATVNLDGLTITVANDITEQIQAIFSVNDAAFSATNFKVIVSGSSTGDATSIVGISIGKDTKKENIAISNSIPGIIDISKDNPEDSEILGEISAESPEADIKTKYDATSQTEFSNALKEYNRVRLTKNISIDSMDISVDNDSFNNHSENKAEYNRDVLDFVGSYTIDLNNHTLTSSVPWDIEDESSMEIVNGILNFNGMENNVTISLFEKARLSLNGVDYTSDSDCILLVNNNDGMRLDIMDSNLKTTGGSYVFSTNASAPDVSQDLVINIQGSTITMANTEHNYSAVLLNVMSDVTITDSTITGDFHALIARGGNFRIERSHIISTGKSKVNADWEYLFSPNETFPAGYESLKNWSQGNMVAYAALVVGNATPGSYVYPTTVEIYDSTVKMTINEWNSKAKDIFMASANNEKVTLISDDSEALQAIIDSNEYERWRGDTCYVQIVGQNEVHLE